MALVPWPAPTATVTLEKARTCLREGIAGQNLSDERTDAFGAAAAAIVARYAAAAPVEILDQAAIRVAGWMFSSAKGDIIPTGVGGELTFAWRPTIGRNALRQSGAMGLLAPWHKPRALILEETE